MHPGTRQSASRRGADCSSRQRRLGGDKGVRPPVRVLRRSAQVGGGRAWRLRVTSCRAGGKHSAALVMQLLRGLHRTGSLDRNAAAGTTQPSRARSGDSECAWTAEAGGWQVRLPPRCGGSHGWAVLRDARHPIVSGRLGTGARGCARGSCRFAKVDRDRAVGCTRCARRSDEASLAEGKTSQAKHGVNRTSPAKVTDRRSPDEGICRWRRLGSRRRESRHGDCRRIDLDQANLRALFRERSRIGAATRCRRVRMPCARRNNTLLGIVRWPARRGSTRRESERLGGVRRRKSSRVVKDTRCGCSSSDNSIRWIADAGLTCLWLRDGGLRRGDRTAAA